MKKVVIVFSGIYLLAIGIFIFVAMLLGFFTSNELTLLLKNNFLFLAATIAYSILLILWPIATGFGILFKKNWARYSVFVMSVFAIFIGISSSVSLILFPQYVYNGQSKSTNYITESFISIINFIFFIGLPIYFMIFFNKKSVKSLFGAKQAQPIEGTRPFGITLIALLAFFTALFSAIFIFMPTHSKSTLIGDIALSGIWEKIYFLAITAINLYISIGFLKMKKHAWVAYIAFYIVSIIIGTVNSFTASKMTFFEIVPNIKSSYKDIPAILYKFSGIIGFILPTVLLAYVISKKRLFFKSKPANSGS